MSTTQAPGSVSLTCKPDKQGDNLVFPYVLTNHGQGDIFVSEAYAHTDPTTRQASADRQAVAIQLLADGDALVLRGVPPLPVGVTAVAPIRPLMARLRAGGTIERTLIVPAPLAETSPYRPYGNVRDYAQAPIAGVVLAVDWIDVRAEAMAAMQPPWADGLFMIHAANLARDTQRASCRFATTNLTMLRRIR